jgi:predicted GNAT superfamily acetyltransferase
MTPSPPADAAHAAETAGVDILELTRIDDLRAATELWCRVWEAQSPDQLMNLSTLRALQHSGNYVAGAFRGETLVGAAVAFRGDGHLHSHVTGVAKGGKGVGYALKLHQRTWALDRGIPEVHWTFDPLVRRNAYFNIEKLGARATAYLVDFYGPLNDGLNRGEPSDRLYVVWDLVARRPAQQPVRRLVPTPADIESLRVTDPDRARRWRFELREQLHGALQQGLRIGAITADGNYVLMEETA